MSTPHELRRRLAHGLRLGAAGVVAAGEARPGVGGARALVPAKVLGETALLCRVAGRLLADDPALARFEGLGAAQARLGEALTRALDPHHAALAVAADPRCRAREAFPFALLGDLDIGHRSVARHLLDLAGDDLGDEPDPFDRLELSWLQGMAEGCASPDVPTGSVLERGADLLHGELTDAYALTHAVLHATDCGLLSPRQLPPGAARSPTTRRRCSVPRSPAATSTSRPSCSGPGRCSTCRSSPGARYALAELDRAEATHGFLPGPEHDPAVAAALAPADRSTYVIQTSYHTAVAGAVLAAALLRTADGDGRAPGGPPASARRAVPTADADPLTLLGHADGPWADALRSRPLAERVGVHRAAWWAPSCAPRPPAATRRGCTRSWRGRPTTDGRTCRRCARAPRSCRGWRGSPVSRSPWPAETTAPRPRRGQPTHSAKNVSMLVTPWQGSPLLWAPSGSSSPGPTM